MEPTIRQARPDDAEAIDSLMKASTRDIFPAFYDAAQTAASVKHISSVDRQLLRDGTYFVLETGGELVACGGWSRRGKLYTGSGDAADDARLIDPATEAARVRAMFVRPDWTRKGLGTRILDACQAAARAEGFSQLILLATLAGLPLYERFGFIERDRLPVAMPDGTTIGCVLMDKPIA